MKQLLITSLCVLFVANVAWADFIDLPVKWSQLPAYEEIDYISNHPSQITRADDFICTDSAPIVAVRWWGSYIDESVPRIPQPGFWKPMDISFHFSDGGEHPSSLPVNPPLSFQTVLAQEEFVGHNIQDEAVYEYNAFLVEPFNQEFGVEYFIDIDDPYVQNWGWHGAVTQNLDWHAMQTPNHVGPWVTGGEADLAFELMIPEPTTMALLGLGSLVFLRKRRA